MRPATFCVLLLLAGCSSAPPKPLLAETKTVEVPVPVRVPCLSADELPARPARVMRPDADIRGLAAGAAAELRAWEAYYDRADALLRSCTTTSKEAK